MATIVRTRIGGGGSLGSNVFGDGSDGVGLFTANTTWNAETEDVGMIVKHFKSLTISEGVTVSAGNRNCGMIIRVNGDCTINGTLANKLSPKTILDTDGVDFSAYPPSLLVGAAGNGGNGGGTNAGAGGSGMVGRFYGGGWSGGGSGGGYSMNSSAIYCYGGAGGSAASVTTAVPNSSLFAGGGGLSNIENSNGSAGSYGGGGGGGLYGNDYYKASSGRGGSSAGASGGNSSTNYGKAAMGGGGAGNYGGGVIILFVAGTLTINGTIDCSGSKGGNGGTNWSSDSRGYFYASQGGGGGGGGRIYIVHKLESVLQGTLNVSGGAIGSYGNINSTYRSFYTGTNATAGGTGDTYILTYEEYKASESK